VQYANSHYSNSLKTTIASFTARHDKLNAARTRTVQGISTLLWLADFAAVKDLKKNLDEAIQQQRSPLHKKLIFPCVVYNLPDRDCAAKASDGELHLADDDEKNTESM
jgi:cellulose 1,4-beta-cellobiosidase